MASLAITAVSLPCTAPMPVTMPPAGTSSCPAEGGQGSEGVGCRSPASSRKASRRCQIS